MAYTNGELRAMLAPVFGVRHDQVQNLVIVVQTDDDYCLTHGLARDTPNTVDRLAHIKLLSTAIVAISAESIAEIIEKG
jgi:hypothetical protein